MKYPHDDGDWYLEHAITQLEWEELDQEPGLGNGEQKWLELAYQPGQIHEQSLHGVVQKTMGKSDGWIKRLRMENHWI